MIKLGDDVIAIRKLSKLMSSDLDTMGFNGFKTNKIYHVSNHESESKVNIELNVLTLEDQYVKAWRSSSIIGECESEVVEQDLSLGAYIGNELIGFILLTGHAWNNSMWIENIRISESRQGSGIGHKLIEHAVKEAVEKEIRMIGLEVQSTNYPAIQFYKKCGFKLVGVDFSRYPQIEGDREQVAIIMSKSLDIKAFSRSK